MARLVSLAVVVALLGACGGGIAERRSDGALLPQDPLELPEMDPDTFRALLAELRGTPVLVNVWATWCPPCVEEAPHLAEVSAEYEGRVQFIGLDILDDRPAAREFIREYGWQYPSVFDPRGEIRDALGTSANPSPSCMTGRARRCSSASGPWTATSCGRRSRRSSRPVARCRRDGRRSRRCPEGCTRARSAADRVRP